MKQYKEEYTYKAEFVKELSKVLALSGAYGKDTRLDYVSRKEGEYLYLTVGSADSFSQKRIDVTADSCYAILFELHKFDNEDYLRTFEMIDFSKGETCTPIESFLCEHSECLLPDGYDYGKVSEAVFPSYIPFMTYCMTQKFKDGCYKLTPQNLETVFKDAFQEFAVYCKNRGMDITR